MIVLPWGELARNNIPNQVKGDDKMWRFPRHDIMHSNMVKTRATKVIVATGAEGRSSRTSKLYPIKDTSKLG